MNNLYLIVPCFNEEDILNDTARELERFLSVILKKFWSPECGIGWIVFCSRSWSGRYYFY